MRSAQKIGERLGIKVTAAGVRHVDDIAPTIGRIAGSATGGLVVLPDGGFIALNSADTTALAAKHGVSAIYASGSMR